MPQATSRQGSALKLVQPLGECDNPQSNSDLDAMSDKQRLNDLITRARIDELMPIDNINRRLGDDFGEMDAQEEIEKHVDSRLATLTATKEEEQANDPA